MTGRGSTSSSQHTCGTKVAASSHEAIFCKDEVELDAVNNERPIGDGAQAIFHLERVRQWLSHGGGKKSEVRLG